MLHIYYHEVLDTIQLRIQDNNKHEDDIGDTR